MVRSKMCKSWCYWLGSQHQHQQVAWIYDNRTSWRIELLSEETNEGVAASALRPHLKTHSGEKWEMKNEEGWFDSLQAWGKLCPHCKPATLRLLDPRSPGFTRIVLKLSCFFLCGKLTDWKRTSLVTCVQATPPGQSADTPTLGE